jgi:uncharacterized membrane protein
MTTRQFARRALSQVWCIPCELATPHAVFRCPVVDRETGVLPCDIAIKTTPICSLTCCRSYGRVIYAAVVLASGVAFLFYSTVGERYESYTLMRVGQGIKDRSAGSAGGPFGDSTDLTSRIESLARIATTDHVIGLAASQVGFARLFPKKEQGLSYTIRQCAAQFDFSQLDFLKAQLERNAGKDTASEKDNHQETVASASPVGGLHHTDMSAALGHTLARSH